MNTGNVTWVDQSTAFQQNLAYINEAGNAIVKVDNFTNVPVGEPRNSVRYFSTVFHVNRIRCGCRIGSDDVDGLV